MVPQFFKLSTTISQACVPGCAVCAMAHPDFVRSVHHISTRGNRLCPPNYYWHTRIFRPSDGPVFTELYTETYPDSLNIFFKLYLFLYVFIRWESTEYRMEKNMKSIYLSYQDPDLDIKDSDPEVCKFHFIFYSFLNKFSYLQMIFLKLPVFCKIEGCIFPQTLTICDHFFV